MTAYSPSFEYKIESSNLDLGKCSPVEVKNVQWKYPSMLSGRKDFLFQVIFRVLTPSFYPKLLLELNELVTLQVSTHVQEPDWWRWP